MIAFTKPGLMGLLLCLAACAPNYSPDTYASRAVQQANKVEAGVVAGRRQIEISADGTTGTVTGAAAGGVAGTRVGGGDITSAFAGIGGGLLGGLIGTGVEKAVGSTIGYEYIVRKPNGDLISVVQRDQTPLALGQKVLVIAGAQARIVPDYTVPDEPAQATPPASPVQGEALAPAASPEAVPPPASAPSLAPATASETAPAAPAEPAPANAETPAEAPAHAAI